MKKIQILFGIGVLACLSVAACASDAPAPAASVMKAAEAKAKAEHKKVLLIFHASWCGWCHKFDGFLSDPKMSKLMNANYEIVHIDVLENGPKKSLENPGGNELLEKYAGKTSGIPFMVIFDASGKKLIDSNASIGGKPASNIGYPAEPGEIAHFMTMLKTAPRLSAEGRSEIEGWLKANAPKTH